MSLLLKFKTNSYYVGGRHYSDTTSIHGSLSLEFAKMLESNCTICRKNKSMNVIDATIEAGGLINSSKSVSKATVNFGKKLLTVH